MAAPRQRINLELLLGISATFLSLAALVVSIFQTQIAREQQQASVWPRLEIESSVVELNFTLSVFNQGVGPAIIKSVDITYKGKAYPSVHKLLFQFTGPLNGGFYQSTIDSEQVIKSGDSVELFSLVKKDEPLSIQLSDVVRDSSFHLRINYSDIYGNCWQLDQNKVTSIGKCSD